MKTQCLSVIKVSIQYCLVAFISFFLFFGLASCGEESAYLPDLEGGMVGYVYTFDEFANLLTDHSDVLITASGNGQFETHTDKAGRFEFKSLPTGTYNLQIEKPGFGSLKSFGIKHLGGTPTIIGLGDDASTYSAFFIYSLSTTEILNLSVTNYTISGEFAFTGNPPASIGVRIYFSLDPDFVLDDASFTAFCSMQEINGMFKGTVNEEDFPYQQGDEVFFKARILFTVDYIPAFSGDIIHGISSYLDLENNQIVYPNEGIESERFSFILQD